ncbi:putative domain SAYSvFN [Phytophthora cactorum]|nr:putative domain SAYSvFN [Phytophthora cactorum]
MPPSRVIRQRDSIMPGDGPPPTEVLDAMRSYAESHQVQEMLHILLTRLLETQPLDSLEFLIQTLQKDDQLDALEKKAALHRFDLRREKTKKQLVLQFYKRVPLARGFLTSQLRLDETRCHLQKLFPAITETSLRGSSRTKENCPAADQGPLDWLVPFVPPVLRVNRDTRAKVRRKRRACPPPHWRSLAFYSLATSIWIGGLVYIHDNEPEFAVAYVILSGFAVLGYHLLLGGERRADGMSAYSVFNRGARRMLGSLSAEQFENEIRHRQPGHEDAPNPRGAAQALDHHDEVYDEDDPYVVLRVCAHLRWEQ